MKRLLFVMRQSAYSGHKIVEVLDAVLISAAFDQEVSILLLDDAVFHLKKQQQGSKKVANIYRSLELYDIQGIYIEQESLESRGLVLSDLVMPVECLMRKKIGGFLHSFDVVLG